MSDEPDVLDPNGEELNNLLTQWHEAKQQADHFNALENSLRRRIFNGLFPNPSPNKTNKVRLPHDMALIGDYRLNYKIDDPAMQASRTLIDPALFDEVITFRPSVRDAAFRELTSEQRQPFTNFITVTPGTPGIELKPATSVRWK